MNKGKEKFNAFSEKVKAEAGTVDIKNIDINALKEKKSLLIAVAGAVAALFLVIGMLFGGNGKADIGHLAGAYRTVDGDTIDITENTFMYNIPDYQMNVATEITQIDINDPESSSAFEAFKGYTEAYTLKSPQGEITIAVDADGKVSYGLFAKGYGRFHANPLEKI